MYTRFFCTSYMFKNIPVYSSSKCYYFWHEFAYMVFRVWPLLTSNSLWPTHKTIGFLYLKDTCQVHAEFIFWVILPRHHTGTCHPNRIDSFCLWQGMRGKACNKTKLTETIVHNIQVLYTCIISCKHHPFHENRYFTVQDNLFKVYHILNNYCYHTLSTIQALDTRIAKNINTKFWRRLWTKFSYFCQFLFSILQLLLGN